MAPPYITKVLLIFKVHVPCPMLAYIMPPHSQPLASLNIITYKVCGEGCKHRFFMHRACMQSFSAHRIINQRLKAWPNEEDSFVPNAVGQTLSSNAFT